MSLISAKTRVCSSPFCGRASPTHSAATASHRSAAGSVRSRVISDVGAASACRVEEKANRER